MTVNHHCHMWFYFLKINTISETFLLLLSECETSDILHQLITLEAELRTLTGIPNILKFQSASSSSFQQEQRSSFFWSQRSKSRSDRRRIYIRPFSFAKGFARSSKIWNTSSISVLSENSFVLFEVYVFFWNRVVHVMTFLRFWWIGSGNFDSALSFQMTNSCNWSDKR